MNTRLSLSAIIALLCALALPSCERKAKPDPKPAALGGDAVSIRELGISFAPPKGWTRIGEDLISAAKGQMEGKTQIGCFNATAIMAFYGPNQEQFIISTLRPNETYDSAQSALSQMARHSAILRNYFSASGQAVNDKMEINGITAFRISGKDDSGYFSKFLCLAEAKRADGSFSVDIVIPAQAFSQEISNEIGESVFAIRRE